MNTFSVNSAVENFFNSALELIKELDHPHKGNAIYDGGPLRGFYLAVEFSATTMDLEEDHPLWMHTSDQVYAHILMHRKNTTNVWSALSPYFVRPAPGDFENTSNHDSCWRTDGLRHLFDAYMKSMGNMNRDIIAYCDKYGLDAVETEIDFEVRSQFSFMSGMEQVDITTARNPESHNRYKLTSIKSLKDFA